MNTVNRIIKAVSIIVAIVIVIGILAAAWSVYFRFPKLRDEVRIRTAQVVAAWFPITEEGGFSYDLEISFSPRKCLIKDLSVTDGSGKALDDLDLAKYELLADLVELNLDAVLKDQPLKIEKLEGVSMYGEITSDAIMAYCTPDRTGMEILETDYDDFTEKVYLLANIQ